MIVAHEAIRERVRALYEAGGLPKGSSTGWPAIDELYTVGLGQWTCITGTPNSGKSEWLDAVMVNLAKREPWKFVIYSPENFPLELHHSKLIEKYIGRPFNPGPNQRASVDEVDEAEAWMDGKFYFAKPEQPTIQAILDEAVKFVSIGNPPRWKTGIVIDPWNQLEHYRMQGMSETEYVSLILSIVINWVREHNCHLWLIAHPAKMQKTKDGSLPIPTPHDISGSAHFWNKADNCITVYRDQREYTKQEVQIHVQKVRFKHIGHIGVAELLYDRVTGRYHTALKSITDYVQERG
jgi:twinkle protein